MNHSRTARGRQGVAAGVLLTVAVLSGAGAVAADRARAEGDEQGGNLSVVVTDDGVTTPAPTPTPTTTPGSGSGTGSGSNTGSGSSSGSGGAGSGNSGAGNGGSQGPRSGAPKPAPGEQSLGGVLYMGGLSGTASPTSNPFDGTVRVNFTVHNVSSTTFDSKVHFWLTGPFNNQLDELDVPVNKLEPGELRVVTADLHGGGQWVLVTAHTKFTPPPSVEDTQLTSATREVTLLLFPWLTACGAVGVGALVMILRVVRGAAAIAAIRRPA